MREVRLIDDHGAQMGVVRIDDALKLAQSRNLDLVEIAPSANPPVCKLLDYGRFKYEQTKREREARKSQKQLVLKQIWFRPNVNVHDRLFKTKQILRFLEEGDKVKVTVRFRGREITHPELARRVLARVTDDLSSAGSIEKPAMLEGRAMTMIVAPGKGARKPHPPAVTTGAEAARSGQAHGPLRSTTSPGGPRVAAAQQQRVSAPQGQPQPAA